MKKRFISILLALGLVMTLIPFSAVPASAVGTIDTGNFPSAPYPPGNKEDVLNQFGYHWDGSANPPTLTLRNAKVDGSILIREAGVVLVLEGTNTVNYGAGGGINVTVPGRLTVRGSGSLALKATNKATALNGDYAFRLADGSALIEQCNITIDHGLAAGSYAIALEEDVNRTAKVNSLELRGGAVLSVINGGVSVPGRLLIEGAATKMSVKAAMDYEFGDEEVFKDAVMCGMLEIIGGELIIDEASTIGQITALRVAGNYAYAADYPGYKGHTDYNYTTGFGFALRVDGGRLYAKGSWQGAWFVGDVYIGNGARTEFSTRGGGSWILDGGDGVVMLRDLYLDGDYYFYATSGFGFWGTGFAFRLTGKEYTYKNNGNIPNWNTTLKPGGPKVISGSRYLTTTMEVLDSYDYWSGIWLGLLSKGWVRGNGNLLKRFKIIPELIVQDIFVPASYVNQAIPEIDVSAFVTGGVPGYTYKFDGPEWLKNGFDPVNGKIKGTPTAPAGETLAMIVVTDSEGNSKTAQVHVGEVQGPPLTFAGMPDIPDSITGTAIPPVNVIAPGAAGGVMPYSFSINGPAWLTINPATGEITGTPTAVAAACTAVVTVTDCSFNSETGLPASKSVTINVGEVRAPLRFENYGWGVPSSETGKPITPVDVTPGVSGGKGPYTFSMTTPAGWAPGSITINPATGVITGTAPNAVKPADNAVVVTVKDATNATASITITVGAVSQALVASDLTFFVYNEFHVPRTYPGYSLADQDQTPSNVGKKIEINVSSGAFGGTPFSSGPAYHFSKVSGPDWLNITQDGSLYGKPPTTAPDRGCRMPTTMLIKVTDSLGDSVEKAIIVGPVSDLRFENDCGTTSYGFTGYGVPPGNPNTRVYGSGNEDDLPDIKCGHPHYGIKGGIENGTGGLAKYKYEIIDGPEWLGIGLNGCFWGVIGGVANTNGVRPAGPRPATTITIKFYDATGAEEIMTLPVGEVYGGSSPQPFGLDPFAEGKFDIPTRLLGTPISENPEINLNRIVHGTLGPVEFEKIEGPEWLQIVFDGPSAGKIYGTPTLDPEHVHGPATAKFKIHDTRSGNDLFVTINVGAVFTEYLRFVKPANAAIPQGEVKQAYDGIAFNVNEYVFGGVKPYTFKLESEVGDISWLQSDSKFSYSETTVTLAGGNRPSIEKTDAIAKITVTDSSIPPLSRSIMVSVGAVVSTPLVFIDKDEFDIPEGLVGTAFDKVTVEATGGAAPYTYTMTRPAGWTAAEININPATGEITGTRPAAAAAAGTATVKVTDNTGTAREITINVGKVFAVQPVPLEFDDSPAYDIPERYVGTAINPTINVRPGVRGGVATVPGSSSGYKFSISSAASWLKIDQYTGVISGVPDVSSAPMSATVSVTDNAVPPATKYITITVGRVKIAYPLTFVKKSSYDVPPSEVLKPIAPVGELHFLDGIEVVNGVSGGTAPYKFTLKVDIPSGYSAADWSWLVIDPNTGVISGTPSERTYARPATTATVTVKDSAVPQASKSITISVGTVTVKELQFSHNGYSIPARNTGDDRLGTFDAQAGNYGINLGVYGSVNYGTTPYTYSISGPDWLQIDQATGRISVKPTRPWVPDPAPPAAVVTVSDGSVSKSISIPVGAVGGTPVLRFDVPDNFAGLDIPARVKNVPVSPEKDADDFITGGNGSARSYTLEMANGKTWLKIRPDGTIWGTPGDSDVGAATTAKVTVKDSSVTDPSKNAVIEIQVGAVIMPLEFKAGLSTPPGTVYENITADASAYVTGGIGPFTYKMTLADGSDWLKIDPNTGAIIGQTESWRSATTATITITDSADYQGKAPVVISGIPVGAVSNVLTFTWSSEYDIPAGDEGVDITKVRVRAGGGVRPYTFSIESGPAWLTIDRTYDPDNGITTGGTLSGTRTPAGPASMAKIKVTDKTGKSAAITISVGAVKAKPGAPLFFGDKSEYDILNNMVGKAIKAVDVKGGVGGGAGGYTFSITVADGSKWLSIDPATGIIKGTPKTEAAKTTAVITVKDSKGATASITIDIGAVAAHPDPEQLPLSFGNDGFDVPAGMVGSKIADIDVSKGVLGGSGYTFSATGLPPGLSINPSTGVISGTPTTPKAGETTATITVKDSNNVTATIQIKVGAIAAKLGDSGTKITVPGGTEGTPITGSAAGGVTGGAAPYTYEKVSGPAWLVVNSNGTLSGTPAQGPATTAAIKVTDKNGNSVIIQIDIGEVKAKPGGGNTNNNTTKYIFTTRFKSNFGNWLLFIFLFGWIWMWFFPR